MNIKYLYSFVLIFSSYQFISAQNIYSLDASKTDTKIQSDYFKMGNAGPEGRQILINNRYMIINGEPVIPVMGELQFSRTPASEWEDRILKMKACGINIISTYIIWIHHEEIEGQFNWQGNNDLRSFVALCAKHGMLVYLRIGPWVHGEVRNGGFPDWLMQKENMVRRSNDTAYTQLVDHYFQQIGLQVKGLMYKDGGPVMGIQLENEYTHGKEGESHIMWLKNTALKYGMDVPMYSVTGWGDGSVPPKEVIPLWGGYPDEPWDFNIEKITWCSNFQFNTFRDDDKIGNNLTQKKNKYMDYSMDPYFTCEMGVGVQNTYHRRLVISSIDGLAMACAKTGSGSNLLGYYIFSGGTNPQGVLTTMNEEKDEGGNWTQTPVISYDFQAPIKESGELAPSYYEIKKLNYFLNEFGKELASMEPVFAPKNNELQYAVRVKDNRAFLFGINYCRNNVTHERKSVQFNIKLKNENVLFPAKPLNISDSSIFIFPINFDMEGTNLKYATAQPLCKINQQNKTTWIFFDALNQPPECCFDAGNIEKIESVNGKIEKKNNQYIISKLKPGLNCVISIYTSTGKEQKIIILTKEQSKQAWLFNTKEGKQFFISADNLYLNGDELNLYGYNHDMQLTILGKGNTSLTTNKYFKQQSSSGEFSTYLYSTEKKVPQFNYKQLPVLDNAQWLHTSIKEINSYNLLYHKLFVKEFSLDNPSKIKSAKMIIVPESFCRLRINDNWVTNQTIDSDKINSIDLTGYVQKGDNKLLLDFSFKAGNKSFAARVVVEYFNENEIEFTSDTSWLTTEEYTFPSDLSEYKMKFKTPEINAAPLFYRYGHLTSEWKINIPADYLTGLNNVYLSINYTGNYARLRKQSELVDDDFNSNVSWNINLKRYQAQQLKLQIFPLSNEDKILFDIPPRKNDIGKTGIKKLRFILEYKLELSLH
ncbi:MAG TPA: beta-galactosidase [Ginsengibacter sp.]